MSSTSPRRRIGATNSETRARLVRAAEQLMLEEGYAAVTSRRVGLRAGLKPQLVHYYFRSMDELFVEILRSRGEENLSSFRSEVARDGSLSNLWRLSRDSGAAALVTEFAALANHRKAIRTEIAGYAERFRAAQLDAITAALSAAGVGDESVPPIAALLIMTGLSQVMALERALGVTTGHAAAVDFVDGLIAGLDPPASGG